MGTPVFHSLTQFEKLIRPFRACSRLGGTTLRKTYSKMVPLSFYHRVFRSPIKFLPDVQGKKKHRYWSPETFDTSFGIRSSRAIQGYIECSPDTIHPDFSGHLGACSQFGSNDFLETSSICPSHVFRRAYKGSRKTDVWFQNSSSWTA